MERAEIVTEHFVSYASVDCGRNTLQTLPCSLKYLTAALSCTVFSQSLKIVESAD